SSNKLTLIHCEEEQFDLLLMTGRRRDMAKLGHARSTGHERK
ncbi:12132_t:CDS:2, partial [Acaulospora colombiana]